MRLQDRRIIKVPRRRRAGEERASWTATQGKNSCTEADDGAPTHSLSDNTNSQKGSKLEFFSEVTFPPQIRYVSADEFDVGSCQCVNFLLRNVTSDLDPRQSFLL